MAVPEASDTRRRSRHPMRATLLLVLSCFVLGGLAQLVWSPVAARYAGIVAVTARPVVHWLQPVRMTERLISHGTAISAEGDLFPGRPLGPIETASYSFYLPFIILLLAGAAWRGRLVTIGEIMIVLGFLFLVHVFGLSFDVLLLQSIFLGGTGGASFGPVEQTVLHGLFRIYILFGMQLWSGVIVALVLARAALGGRAPQRSSAGRLNATGGVALACGLLLAPAMLYVVVTPMVRAVSGSAGRARMLEVRILDRRGDKQGAERLARRLVESNSQQVDAMMIIAGYAAQRSTDEAAEWYSRVIAVDPGNLNAGFFLGAIDVHRKDWGSAVRRLKTVLVARPGHAGTHFELGRAYFGQRDLSAARLHFERTIDLDPRHSEAFAELGHVYLLSSDGCAAAAAYESSLAGRPDGAGADRVRRGLDQAKIDCRDGSVNGGRTK